jgi:hypothetical protein
VPKTEIIYLNVLNITLSRETVFYGGKYLVNSWLVGQIVNN